MAQLPISCSTVSGTNQEEEFDLPLGYRFSPNGKEIIIHYLTNKILNQQLPTNIIRDIDFYDHDPHELPISEFKYCKPDEAYFFTQLENRDDVKRQRQRQTRRSTKNGFWKVVGEDEEIIWNNSIVGFKKTMIYYEGREPRGVKSRWITHEFRVNPLYLSAHALDKTTESKVENLVCCKIHYRKESDNKRSKLPATKGLN